MTKCLKFCKRWWFGGLVLTGIVGIAVAIGPKESGQMAIIFGGALAVFGLIL